MLQGFIFITGFIALICAGFWLVYKIILMSNKEE